MRQEKRRCQKEESEEKKPLKNLFSRNAWMESEIMGEEYSWSHKKSEIIGRQVPGAETTVECQDALQPVSKTYQRNHHCDTEPNGYYQFCLSFVRFCL